MYFKILILSLIIFLLAPKNSFSWEVIPFIGSGAGSWNESRQMNSYLIAMKGQPFSVLYGVKTRFYYNFLLLALDFRKDVHTWEYSPASESSADSSFSDSTAGGFSTTLEFGIPFNGNKTSFNFLWSPYSTLTISPNVDRNYPYDQTYNGFMLGGALNHQVLPWLFISIEYLKYSYSSFTQNDISYELPATIDTNIVYSKLTRTSILLLIGVPWSF